MPEAVGRRYTDGEATRNPCKARQTFLRRSETAKELLPSGQLCDLSGLRLIHLSGPGYASLYPGYLLPRLRRIGSRGAKLESSKAQATNRLPLITSS